MSGLPKGLDSYEFVRRLEASRDLPKLWHYMPVLEENGKNPLLTPDGKPDIQDFSWSTIFPSSTPIELEIGSGRGSFLADYALQCPQISILGSEWDAGWAHFAGRRLLRQKVENAAMLRGDIFFFLQNMVPDHSLQAVHMYFPDPWPKARHHKNRLMRPNFLQELRRVLVQGENRFYWATDHARYNEEAQQFWANLPFIEILQRDTASPTQGITTGFERKYLVEGRPIYRSVLRLL